MTLTTYILVPIIGATALLCGGVAVTWKDRWDLQAGATEPRPILIRYTSQAAYDLRKWPHWIFVAACLVFGPCLIVSATWQAETTTDPDLANALRLYSMGCAIGGFLVAAVPMGIHNMIGTAFHMIHAALFVSFGIMYGYSAWKLAQEYDVPPGGGGSESDDRTALAAIRLTFFCLALLGVSVMGIMLYPAIVATHALKGHQDLIIQSQDNNSGRDESNKQDEHIDLTKKEGYLSEQERIKYRWYQAVLAMGQSGVAMTLALELMTAVVEVNDLAAMNDDDDKASHGESWQRSVWPSVGMFLTAAFFVVTNNFFYAWCQAADEEDRSNDNEDDNDTDRVINTNDDKDTDESYNQKETSYQHSKQ